LSTCEQAGQHHSSSQKEISQIVSEPYFNS
jgi:hypothetical protein